LLLGINNLLFTFPDEGRNAYATLYMIKTSDFIIPYYNGDIRYDKPPLLYYLGVLFYYIIPIDKQSLSLEFLFRLVSVLSIFFSSLVLFELSKSFIREKIFRYFSVIIFVSFVNIFIESKAFVPEPLLTLFINLSLLIFYKIYTKLKDNNYIDLKFIFLFWISLGLGILSKGIVSLIVIFLVIVVFLLINKELSLIKYLFNPILAPILGLFLGFSWFIAVGIKTSGDFLYNFFLVHNIGRFTGSSNMHINPPYFYIYVIFINLFPILEITLLSILIFIKELMRDIRNFWNDYKFLIVYFLVIIIFYSLSKGKVHHYIMPSFLPMAILISLLFEKISDLNYKIKKIIIFAAIFYFILFFIKVSPNFLVLKNILTLTLTLFAIAYLLINKDFIVYLTALKTLVFYGVIIWFTKDIFPNQKEFLKLIKDKNIFMIGDISTVSFYNLKINNKYKTKDIFYLIEEKTIRKEDLKDIKKGNSIIFLRDKYLDIVKNVLLRSDIKEFNVRELQVASSKLTVIEIK